MAQGRVERRRGRRIPLEVPLLIKRSGTAQPEPIAEHLAKDIGLAGVYFEVEGDDTYKINETVLTSVSIPESKRRDFPFTRVAGRGRVVRVTELPQEGPGDGKRFGIALEFGSDVTVLSATPSRG